MRSLRHTSGETRVARVGGSTQQREIDCCPFGELTGREETVANFATASSVLPRTGHLSRFILQLTLMVWRIESYSSFSVNHALSGTPIVRRAA